MARPLRLHVPGGFYHVTLRGNHRQPIFFAERDRILLDEVVGSVVTDLSARIHAYCWMTNHVHILIQVSDAPLGRIILRIASRYARKVQEGIGTTGHLFERRYHSVLVDADNYLLTLLRYIHLNPVRAGLVDNPSAYPWSSHSAYIGHESRHWLTTDFALRLFSQDREQARMKYLEWMNNQDPCRWGVGALAPHRDNRQVLGSDEFVARVARCDRRQRLRVSLEELVNECSRRYGLSPEALASNCRTRDLGAARAWLAHEAVAGHVASICAVARRLGRSETAIRNLMIRRPRLAEDKRSNV